MIHKPITPITTIETIVSRMRYTGSVSNVVASGSNWSFTTNDSTDLTLNEYITIGAGSHKVINLPNATSVIVDGVQPVGSTWTAQSPFFYHGTPDKIDPDRKKDMRGNIMKYPFICLFEPISSVENFGSNPIAEDLELWMVFMNYASDQLTTDQHHTIINNMNALYLRFVDACQKYRTVCELEDDFTVNKIRHAQYGLVAKLQGHEKYFLNDNLSGIEIENFKLRIKKTYC